MKDLKVVTRLGMGFGALTLLVVAVGLIGLYGTTRQGAVIKDFGATILPNTRALLQIEIATTWVADGENFLIARGVDQRVRADTYASFRTYRSLMDQEIKVYDATEFISTSDKALWEQFKPLLSKWWAAHLEFEKMARAWDADPQNEALFQQASRQAVAVTPGLLTDAMDVLHRDLDEYKAGAYVRTNGAVTSGRGLTLVTAGAIALGTLIAVLLGVLIALSITRPLAKGVAFARSLADGDFTRGLDIRQKDEIGALAAALNAMRERLRNLIVAIQASAVQVASSSEEISASAQRLAEGAQSQASSLEETSASVEELTASVDQVADHAQSQASGVEQGTASMGQMQKSIESVSANLADISGLAGKSLENAAEGAGAVRQVVTGITRIAESSEKISGIVNVISDIADQTNLLALNASIEAARAGEHGRGFAVVADEVSKLAERSAASTKEIAALITESTRAVTDGVSSARGSQEAMERIRQASEEVRDMISSLSGSMGQQAGATKELAAALGSINEMSMSISAATEEQTTNARQVSAAVESVNELTQAAASAAEEMSASTQQLSGMAQELQRMISQFRTENATDTAIMKGAVA